MMFIIKYYLLQYNYMSTVCHQGFIKMTKMGIVVTYVWETRFVAMDFGQVTSFPEVKIVHLWLDILTVELFIYIFLFFTCNLSSLAAALMVEFPSVLFIDVEIKTQRVYLSKVILAEKIIKIEFKPSSAHSKVYVPFSTSYILWVSNYVVYIWKCLINGKVLHIHVVLLDH